MRAGAPNARRVLTTILLAWAPRVVLLASRALSARLANLSAAMQVRAPQKILADARTHTSHTLFARLSLAQAITRRAKVAAGRAIVAIAAQAPPFRSSAVQAGVMRRSSAFRAAHSARPANLIATKAPPAASTAPAGSTAETALRSPCRAPKAPSQTARTSRHRPSAQHAPLGTGVPPVAPSHAIGTTTIQI